MKSIFSLLLFLTFTISGISQTIDSIKVGNGGGVTGFGSVYKISNLGISKKSATHLLKFDKATKIKKSDFQKMCHEAVIVTKNHEAFSKPYNTYKFLEIYSKGASTKYTWGDPNFKVPVEVEKLYSNIIQTIAKLKMKP